ncbi:hypothetical protein [Streptosporangium saharense]|uniref:hypothetical protein n=1 Tax=Streptosporangium saharense TaxID=1706840 RepID=UPI0033288146
MIPADLAVLDYNARCFSGVDPEHITDLARSPELRESLGVPRRDGWIIPLTDGILAARVFASRMSCPLLPGSSAVLGSAPGDDEPAGARLDRVGAGRPDLKSHVA